MAAPSEGLRYDRWVERALRSVVVEALEHAAAHGLPGAHHFYVTFRTTAPGVEIPEHLRQEYPETMTIVLQHQYWGLEVREDGFTVTLSFRRVHERLVIPFAAIVAFADPSVNFALQFEAVESRAEGAGETVGDAAPEETKPRPTHPAGPRIATVDGARSTEKPEQRSAEVVAIDAFRKK
ncbi:MAG: hypothetical protein JNK11_01695 [Alphaproteobacteria bacterium]|nr:hypothetical protein [Alphaproteobacteria bacterium]